MKHLPDTLASAKNSIQRTVLHRRLAEGHNQFRRPASFRRRIVRGAAVSLTGLSILLAGLFHSPSELIRQQTIQQLNRTVPVEIMIEEEDFADPEDDEKKTAAPRRSLIGRIADSVRAAFLRLPAAVRACVGIPLWAAGYGMIHLFSFLFSPILSPVLMHILGWILTAAVLIGVFAVTMKCIFPHMPWRQILRKRNLLILLAAAGVLKLLDILLPLFWTDYHRVKYLVMLIAGILLLGLILYRLYLRGHKAKTA